MLLLRTHLWRNGRLVRIGHASIGLWEAPPSNARVPETSASGALGGKCTCLQSTLRRLIQGENLAFAGEHKCRPSHVPQTRGAVSAECHPYAGLDLGCGGLSHVCTVAEALAGLRHARRHLLAVHQAIEQRCFVPRPERVEGERGELNAVNICEGHREASHNRFQCEHLGNAPSIAKSSAPVSMRALALCQVHTGANRHGRREQLRATARKDARWRGFAHRLLHGAPIGAKLALK